MNNITALTRQRYAYYLLPILMAVGIGFIIALSSYDWQGMLLVLGGIGILSVFLLPRLARVESDGFLLEVLIFGLLLKLAFAIVNYYFAFNVYGGSADASYYHTTGTQISQYIWNLEFDKVAPFLNWGTDFVCFFTGVIYSIIGPSIFGGFLVYAFLSFLGSYYFYRAFRIAFPDGSKRLYASLIFFLPSILFWPSAIGKDALMFLCLGLFAYGSARLLVQNRLRGLVLLALGFVGTLWVRPHVAAALLLALGIAFFLPGARKKPFPLATYIIGLVAVGILAWFSLPKVMAYLNLKGLSPDEIVAYMQQFQGSSAYGGSALQATNFNNPLTYLMAPIIILFRPFPWEAHNLQALLESLEGMFILFLVFWRIKRLGRGIASSLSNIYSRYVLIYIITFIIIFAAIGNLGTLARERVMLYPFFLMLVSYGPSRLTEKQKQPAGSINVSQT